MSQWGFYFDQNRCVGCKTCVLACKQWNEERRGDANIFNIEKDNNNYLPAAPTSDTDAVKDIGSNYIDPATGETNFKLYQQYHMKESWRRMEDYETGYCKIGAGNAFEHNIERRYLSVSCNHCEKPECIEACPVANIHKDPKTGAVQRKSASVCISCGRCKDACPWSAPQFYDDNFASYAITDPKRPRMTKCTMCSDRINAGKDLKTACAAACWNRALEAGPMNELKAKYPDAVAFDQLPEFMNRNTSVDIKAMGPNIIFKKKVEY